MDLPGSEPERNRGIRVGRKGATGEWSARSPDSPLRAGSPPTRSKCLCRKTPGGRRRGEGGGRAAARGEGWEGRPKRSRRTCPAAPRPPRALKVTAAGRELAPSPLLAVYTGTGSSAQLGVPPPRTGSFSIPSPPGATLLA